MATAHDLANPTHEQLYDRNNWFRLPRIYRTVRVADKYIRPGALIGFRVRVFLPELSSFAHVNLGVSEAFRYLFYRPSSDVEACWLAEDGRVVHRLMKVARNERNLAIALHNGDYVAYQLGFYESPRFTQTPDYAAEHWYTLNGPRAYRLQSDQMINVSDYTFGNSFSTFDCEVERHRNLMGITTVGREYHDIRIANEYAVNVLV